MILWILFANGACGLICGAVFWLSACTRIAHRRDARGGLILSATAFVYGVLCMIAAVMMASLHP